MAKLDVKVASTSVSLAVFIQDSSSTTGAGLTGLVFNTASLVCYAVVPGSSAAAITLATLAAANSAWSSGGFKEIDATNMPGWYRFDVPDTNISTGRSVCIHFKGATNMAPLPIEISLTAWNNQSATDGGMSKLASLTFTGANKVDASVRDWVGDTIPARNVTGVPLVDAKYLLGTIFSTPTVAGIPNVNVKTWNDLTTVALPLIPTVAGRTLDCSAGGEAGVDWANVGSPTTAVALTGTSVLLSAGTGTGQLDFTSGVVKANLAQILGTALTETAGLLAGGFKKFFNMASPTGTINSIPDAVAGAAGGIAIVGSNMGSVASVTAGVSVAVAGIPSGAHAAAEMNALADALLNRNMATGTDSGTDDTTVRTVRQALRRMRNKESITLGVGTITKEDDSTASWTYAATTSAGNPISSVDPT